MSTAPTIASVRDTIARRKASAREIAADYFRRISAENDALNGYLTLCEERAYAQAERVDQMVRAGQPLPPLAGVPIAVNFRRPCFSMAGQSPPLARSAGSRTAPGAWRAEQCAAPLP